MSVEVCDIELLCAQEERTNNTVMNSKANNSDCRDDKVEIKMCGEKLCASDALLVLGITFKLANVLGYTGSFF